MNFEFHIMEVEIVDSILNSIRKLKHRIEDVYVYSDCRPKL